MVWYRYIFIKYIYAGYTYLSIYIYIYRCIKYIYAGFASTSKKIKKRCAHRDVGKIVNQWRISNGSAVKSLPAYKIFPSLWKNKKNHLL